MFNLQTNRVYYFGILWSKITTRVGYKLVILKKKNIYIYIYGEGNDKKKEQEGEEFNSSSAVKPFSNVNEIIETVFTRKRRVLPNECFG